MIRYLFIVLLLCAFAYAGDEKGNGRGNGGSRGGKHEKEDHSPAPRIKEKKETPRQK